MRTRGWQSKRKCGILQRPARAAGEPRGERAGTVPATLTDAKVISIKEELALVVANVGRRQGVKVGMPFKVVRGDGEIGLVRVVDVRDGISGAVIQSLESDKNKIKVGDRLQVATTQ